MDATVLVATCGDLDWSALAARRAIPSAARQAPVIHVHGQTLAGARNEALAEAESEWVIHLDADDELLPGYIDAMARGSADLRAPAVQYVRGKRTSLARLPRVAGHRHRCRPECLEQGNWLVVGTAARRDLLLDAGGWQEWPVYEDWALWLRCYRKGATVEGLPEAIYRAHARPDSRNRGPSIDFKNRVHAEILAA